MLRVSQRELHGEGKTLPDYPKVLIPTNFQVYLRFTKLPSISPFQYFCVKRIVLIVTTE